MPTFTYTALDDHSATGGTFAGGINGDGQIVGSYVDVNGAHGFLYSGGSYITLDDPSGQTLVYGINISGQIVGEYRDGSGYSHAFLYSSGSYTTLPAPSASTFNTRAYAINDQGQIVGQHDDASGVHGFFYSGGSYTTLDDPSSSTGQTQALGINDNGQIVGGYITQSGEHGFLYSGGNYTTLDVPSAFLTVAYGINGDGQITGLYTDVNGQHGFLYSGGAFTRIDDPLAAGNTQAFGINGSGQIVGAYQDASGGEHGFLASSDLDNGPEAPTLTITNHAVSVTAGGSVSLPISATAVDSDDKLSVTISGVPSFEKIKAPSGDVVTSQKKGTTYTYTIAAGNVGQGISGLVLSSSYKGKGHPVSSLTVTSTNSTTGESASAPAQTITVTDPPASQTDVSNFATLGYSDDNAPSAFIGDAGPHAASASLLRQYLASSFVTTAGDLSGTPISDPSQSREQWLTLPHAGAAA
jgi:probable HAF family extracellular repeat protein